MSSIRISGREYPERPPNKSAKLERKRRLMLIVQSLNFASETCSETERRIYKSIREAQAHAENLLDQVKGERLPDPQLSDLSRHELEL